MSDWYILAEYEELRKTYEELSLAISKLSEGKSMVTDRMVDAGLSALGGKIIDGRQFWTADDRGLMRLAIEAAIATGNTDRRLDKLESMGLRDAAKYAASCSVQHHWERRDMGGSHAHVCIVCGKIENDTRNYA